MCRKGIFFFSLLISFFLQAGEPIRQTICLNMIVKNESRVIARCLESVKPLIDTWVIVDTGSSDGTQEIIKEYLKELPGTLYERPWVDFGHNRQEALELAKDKADYILFMDADETLVYPKDFSLKQLDRDYYYITVQDTSLDKMAYNRFFLINSRLPWKWKDILHEYLQVPAGAKGGEKFAYLLCQTDSDGFRSQDPQKYLKDAQVFEKALEKDPNNARYVFYLAQSYANGKDYESALKNYLKRAEMKSGWDKEIYWSYYMAGCLSQELKKEEEQILRNYAAAYMQDPTRAEPLFRMTNYYNEKGKYLLGYAVGKLAISLQEPLDEMFVLKWIYDYGALSALSDSSFYLGKKEETLSIFDEILSKKSLPEQLKKSIESKRSILLSKNK
jgi:glycosyltransferase involved in cell wall biosynthesis